MTKQTAYSVVEVRSTLPDLLARVEVAKERITITKNGKPKAALVSIEDLNVLEAMKSKTNTKATKT